MLNTTSNNKQNQHYCQATIQAQSYTRLQHTTWNQGMNNDTVPFYQPGDPHSTTAHKSQFTGLHSPSNTTMYQDLQYQLSLDTTAHNCYTTSSKAFKQPWETAIHHQQQLIITTGDWRSTTGEIELKEGRKNTQHGTKNVVNPKLS